MAIDTIIDILLRCGPLRGDRHTARLCPQGLRGASAVYEFRPFYFARVRGCVRGAREKPKNICAPRTRTPVAASAHAHRAIDAWGDLACESW